MAVTKIWRVRGSAGRVIDYINNPEKTVDYSSEDLKHVIEYVDNEVKTECHMFTTGINCESETAELEFNVVKEEFGKQGGLVAIHGYQSFSEGEVTAEMAHEIGVKLAEELWGDRFQVLVATHLNTKCYHNHFVINTVSHIDGKRFHMCTDRYNELRSVSDRLCQEYGLSIIENPRGKRVPMHLYKLEQDGAPTRYNVARAVIDEAISLSCNMEEFKAELRRMGCTYRFVRDRKYWTITPPGWNKPIRCYRLGEDYSNIRIVERVEGNDISARHRKYEIRAKQPNNYRLKRRVHKIMERSGLEKLYLRYCYELGYLPKYTQNPKRLHYLLKEDLLKCEMYSREARLLSRNRIVSWTDLLSYKDKTEKRMESLMDAREEERRIIKRKLPEDEIENRRESIKEMTKELRELRSEMKLIQDIEERSSKVLDKMQYLEEERERARDRGRSR